MRNKRFTRPTRIPPRRPIRLLPRSLLSAAPQIGKHTECIHHKSRHQKLSDIMGTPPSMLTPTIPNSLNRLHRAMTVRLRAVPARPNRMAEGGPNRMPDKSTRTTLIRASLLCSHAVKPHHGYQIGPAPASPRALPDIPAPMTPRIQAPAPALSEFQKGPHFGLKFCVTVLYPGLYSPLQLIFI